MGAKIDSRVWAQDFGQQNSSAVNDTPEGAERSPASPENLKDGMVVVEPPLIIPVYQTGLFKRPSYASRRSKWGRTFSLSYSEFKPIYYVPNFYTANFEDIYESVEIPLIEMNFAWKRNMSMGSLAIEFGFGGYQNESDVEELPSTLKIYPIHLGAVLALDNIFREPYVVPYFSMGLYTIHYSESVSSSSFNGFTQTSFYGSAGLLLQLDWCDPQSSMQAYLENGIQNTFLFLEGKKLLASSAAKDPDFETDIYLSGGLKVEY
ncbi:MAG: hypothetical protein KDD35_02485 [Bdellovibrionales bacterium]|nr:hypothetical protein [Bdellovibrionales bacterium]